MSAACAVRVIPADVFDTVEFSALVYGGIGAGRWTAALFSPDAGAPLCVIGHIAQAVADLDGRPDYGAPLVDFSSEEDGNDEAVRAINVRNGAEPDARVTFEEYITERNWVRGDA